MIIPEEIEHIVQGFLFTYPEVDNVDMKLKNPNFVKYMKSITVRTVKVEGSNIAFYMDGILHNEEFPTISGDYSYWYKNGILHSENDQPAIMYQNGVTRYWYKDGIFHREGDKPAVVRQNGDQHWYKDGKLHRENDKPALVRQNGDQHWYNDGNFQRVLFFQN